MFYTTLLQAQFQVETGRLWESWYLVGCASSYNFFIITNL